METEGLKEAINNFSEEQLAMSVARDAKLLPFLVRQFCGVNCKLC